MTQTDEGLWETLTAHRASVRQVLHRFTAEAETEADLEQETFLRALLALPSLRKPESVKGWLQSIARNLALGRQRQLQRKENARQVAGDLRMLLEGMQEAETSVQMAAGALEKLE